MEGAGIVLAVVVDAVAAKSTLGEGANQLILSKHRPGERVHQNVGWDITVGHNSDDQINLILYRHRIVELSDFVETSGASLRILGSQRVVGIRYDHAWRTH